MWTIIGILTFFVLLKINAPYGKFARKGWGRLIDSRIGFFLMEIISPVLFFLLFLYYSKELKNTNLVLLSFLFLWESAYLYRALIYPFLRKKEKNISVSIVIFSIIFNSINVYLITTSIFYSSSKYALSWFFDIRFLSGFAIFILGSLINVKSDVVLGSIRKSRKDRTPQGFLFNYVSSPHYLGEIIKWAGFALIIWTWAGLSFLIWTCSNLIPRAIANHRWYTKNFKDYPRNRKALIPYVF